MHYRRWIAFGMICFIFLVYIGCTPSAYYKADQTMKQGKYNEAIALFKSALAEKPDDTRSKNGLAHAYFSVQNYDAAIKEYNESLAIKPDQPDVLLNLGTVYIAKKDYRNAEATWSRYKDSDQPKIAEELARLNTLVQYEAAKQVAAESSGRPAAPAEENAVIVCDLKDLTADKSMAAVQKALTVLLIEDLKKLKGVKVVDRVKTQMLMEEIQRAQPGISDDQVAARLKELLGAENVIMGTLSKGSYVANTVFTGRVDGMAKVVISESQIFELPVKIIEDWCRTYGTIKSQECPTFKPRTSSPEALIAFGKAVTAMDGGRWDEARTWIDETKKHDPDFGLAEDLSQTIPDAITDLSDPPGIQTHLEASRTVVETEPASTSDGGGGGGPCFAPETLVLMADGSSKRIIDIAVGDTVVAFDEKTGKKVSTTVVATKSGAADYHYIINGEIKVTPPHPFYTADNKWVKIADLQVGQTVRISSSFSTITSSKKIDKGHKIYNILVKDFHNFFVSGNGKEFFLVKEGK